MVHLQHSQYINAGSWANIYLLSPRRIIKVYRDAYRHEEEQLIRDELAGTKYYKHALPILRVISVITPQGKRAKGMIKKYLPYKVTKKELLALYKNRKQCMPWDGHAFNYRKDYDGTIWMVDTQIIPVCRIPTNTTLWSKHEH